MSKGFFSCFQ